MQARVILASWSCDARSLVLRGLKFRKLPIKETKRDFEKRHFIDSMIRYFYMNKTKILTENTSTHQIRYIKRNITLS